MKNKKLLIGIGAIVIFIGILVYLFLFQLGAAYRGKASIGEYKHLLLSQYTSLNQNNDPIYRLPDKYTFYGRYALEDGLCVVNDRMVSKCFFRYDNKTYYFYYSGYQKMIKAHERCPSFELTYPDVYNEDTNEIAFTLWENPEGYYVSDNYLYYVYGKNYYCVRGLDLHNYLFSYSNKKDYSYARSNLDTLENEKISKEQYEEKYSVLYASIYGNLP